MGNQRGGARDLAQHLLKEENEHVDVHELRGFAADTLPEALNEAYAVSRGTRCKQFLFSVSLNPPPGKNVSTEEFISAVDRIEEKMGLAGQPRAVVFHEKEGRRHAHAVWSRIDIEKMKAVQLSHSKRKLQDVSRDLFREHGWDMPPGHTDRSLSDPRNFTLAEWQQAKREGKDARAIKTAFQDAWAISDSRAAFTHALEERGYKIARGDRRGFVAIDHQGEVYSIPKWANVKTREVRDRLGDEAELPSLEEARSQYANEMRPAMQRLKGELDDKAKRETTAFEARRKELVERQRGERRALTLAMEKRRTEENRIRQARFRKGFKGLWDRLNGEHKRIQDQNLKEAEAARRRDGFEKDRLVFGQVERRRRLGEEQRRRREENQELRRDLAAETQKYEAMRLQRRADRKAAFLEKRRTPNRRPAERTRDLE
ncbi:MAG: relaxase/mobilization nuclease domain-containing protein [Pseudomonadota bacterium]